MERRNAYRACKDGSVGTRTVCVPDWEVIPMFRADILTGLLIGITLGLVFTAELAPYLAAVVVLAVLFGTKMIDRK